MTEQLKGKPVANFQNRYLCKDGTYKWLAWQATSADKNGKVYAVATNINDLKKAENALLLQEARIKSIFRSVPVGIGVVSNRILLEVNDRLCEMTGYSKEELVNKNSRKLYPTKKEFDYVGREKYEQIKKHGTGTVETRFKRKDGKIIDIILSSTPIDFDDMSKGVTFTVLDITKRKRVDDKLKKQQYYLTQAQKIGNIGTWELDLIKNELTWTDQSYINFGVPIGTPLTYEIFLDCIYPDDREYVNTEWMAAIDGKPYDIEHRLIVDGEVRWMREKAYVEFDKSGKAIKAIGFTQDITDIKLAKEELEKSEKQFRLLAEHTYDWEYMIKPDGTYVYVSPSCERITGYSPKEFLANPNLLTEITKPDFAEKVQTHFRDGNNKDSPIFSIEISIITKNGEERWLEHNCIPIFDDDGQYIGRRGNNQDITERKLAENDLRKRLNELEIWNDVTVDRELKMLELKKEINELLEKLHKNPKYKIPI